MNRSPLGMGIGFSVAERGAVPRVRPRSSPEGARPSSPSSPRVDLSRSRWFPSRKNDALGALPSLKDRTILVLDDDPDALELLHMILESCGAKVLAASTAMHARGYLLTVTPDLIVCDLALPREDGPAFMRTVRASSNPALARVPAVAVTAFYEDYPPTRALEFAAYFQKPIDIDALARTIASLLPPR
jgi:CheY-like chemotaxis protein